MISQGKFSQGTVKRRRAQAGINDDAADPEKRDNNNGAADDAKHNVVNVNEREERLNVAEPGVIINGDQTDKGKGDEQERLNVVKLNVVNVNENEEMAEKKRKDAVQVKAA